MLKYLLPVHDAHLAVLCVGQSVPDAPVPPMHVHCFVTQARLFEPLQATDSYSLASHAALHVSQALSEFPASEYRPASQSAQAVFVLTYFVPAEQIFVHSNVAFTGVPSHVQESTPAA